jgi:hypothetical protein
VGMDLGSLAVLLTALVGGTGLWSVLRLVVRGWNAVRLERARNESWTAATAAFRDMSLAVGVWLFEHDRSGGFRAIHLPESPSPVVGCDTVLEEGGDGTVR